MAMMSPNWFIAEEQISKHNCIWAGEVNQETLEYYRNFVGDTSNNYNLAGHLERQIRIEDMPESVKEDIMKNFYRPEIERYMKTQKDTSHPLLPIGLESVWINYQKKHEFNPMHNHGGLFSFVIFINVPYDLEEEDKFFPEKKDPKTSRLCFVMNSPMGVPEEVAIPVDKGFEGKMLLFDAKLPHMVYPFYTSDKERVTASGNVVYVREGF